MIVTERLLHEETKIKSRPADLNQEGALTIRFKKRLRCHFCNRLGHINRECEEYTKVKGQAKPKKKAKTGAFKVTISAEDENSSEGESTGLVVTHALSAESTLRDQWISWNLEPRAICAIKKACLSILKLYTTH